MTQEQLDYVTSVLATGADVEALKNTLRNNGYEEGLINQLVAAAQNSLSQSQIQGAGIVSETTSQTNPVNQTVSQAAEKSNTVKIVKVVGVLVVLVVVVGLAVLLSSINSARMKGMDASTKQTLSTARSQAEIYLNQTGLGYAGFCDSAAATKLFAYVESGVDCLDSETTYRFVSQLNSGAYYCVVMEDLGGGEYNSELVEVTEYPTGFFCE